MFIILKMAGKEKSIAGAIEAGVLKLSEHGTKTSVSSDMRFRGPGVDGTFSEIFHFRLTKLSKC